MKTTPVLFLATAGALLLQEGAAVRGPGDRVGPLADGGFLLNSGWAIRPAGEQVPVDTFPISTALSANGKWLLVLNAGYNPPSVSVIEIANRREIGRTPLPDAWLGLTIAQDRDDVYVGGGSSATAYELALNPQTGALTRKRDFRAVQAISNKASPFIGDVAISPDGHLLYAADLYSDSIAVINLQSGTLIDDWKTGRRPYRLLLSPTGRRLLVTSWAEGTIYEHDANSGTLVAKTRVGPHPTDMIWLNKTYGSGAQATYVGRVFVAAANTNNVYSFGVSSDGQLNAIETINVSLTPMHPLGMTPSALASDSRGTRLYVVCSDANAVAVADIAGEHNQLLGFIPTGWYPTAVRVLPDSGLVILNGKGLGSRPNPKGPNPTVPGAAVKDEGNVAALEYVARIQTGTAAILPIPDDTQLGAYSNTVIKNSPYRDELIYGPIDDAQVAYFAKSESHSSPIQHMIYIIKENRTYDQVFGDIPQGNGDKSLNMFGEKITPNQHQMARDFILYDNFYENADVSAEGHNWASAAIAPDYTVKLWPSEYGHRRATYDFEGGEQANSPPAGYIWNNALQAGLKVRDYGQWVRNIPLDKVKGAQQVQTVNDPALRNHADMNYRGFDLGYPDVDRAKEFIREWKDFESKSDAPNLAIVRLGNNHTLGTRPGALSPFSLVADNDYALGMLVDAVSQSKFWPSTAIFVIEDDAQNGPDHVDSHRAPALVLSPYTRRGIVDSAMYNQTSVLRTIELIGGVRPMTHFDAAARPMFGSFSRQADTRPYTALSPQVSLTQRNPSNAPGAKQSARMDFSDADKIDDDELNTVLWRAIKRTEPPAPVTSRFVLH